MSSSRKDATVPLPPLVDFQLDECGDSNPIVKRTHWPLDIPKTTRDYLAMVYYALYDPKNYGGMKFGQICSYLRQNFTKVPRVGYNTEIWVRKLIAFMMSQEIVCSVRKVINYARI